jgi:hypothetical protein
MQIRFVGQNHPDAVHFADAALGIASGSHLNQIDGFRKCTTPRRIEIIGYDLSMTLLDFFSLIEILAGFMTALHFRGLVNFHSFLRHWK